MFICQERRNNYERLYLVIFRVKLIHKSNIVRVDLDVAHQFIQAMDIFEMEPIDPCVSDFDLINICDVNEYIRNTSRYSTKKVSV